MRVHALSRDGLAQALAPPFYLCGRQVSAHEAVRHTAVPDSPTIQPLPPPLPRVEGAPPPHVNPYGPGPARTGTTPCTHHACHPRPQPTSAPVASISAVDEGRRVGWGVAPPPILDYLPQPQLLLHLLHDLRRRHQVHIELILVALHIVQQPGAHEIPFFLGQQVHQCDR